MSGKAKLPLGIEDFERIRKDGFYYMLMRIQQPIGDYGSHWVERWHKCEEQYISKIQSILQIE